MEGRGGGGGGGGELAERFEVKWLIVTKTVFLRLQNTRLSTILSETGRQTDRETTPRNGA